MSKAILTGLESVSSPQTDDVLPIKKKISGTSLHEDAKIDYGTLKSSIISEVGSDVAEIKADVKNIKNSTGLGGTYNAESLQTKVDAIKVVTDSISQNVQRSIDSLGDNNGTFVKADTTNILNQINLINSRLDAIQAAVGAIGSDDGTEVGSFLRGESDSVNAIKLTSTNSKNLVVPFDAFIYWSTASTSESVKIDDIDINVSDTRTPCVVTGLGDSNIEICKAIVYAGQKIYCTTTVWLSPIIDGTDDGLYNTYSLSDFVTNSTLRSYFSDCRVYGSNSYPSIWFNRLGDQITASNYTTAAYKYYKLIAKKKQYFAGTIYGNTYNDSDKVDFLIRAWYGGANVTREHTVNYYHSSYSRKTFTGYSRSYGNVFRCYAAGTTNLTPMPISVIDNIKLGVLPLERE